MGKQFMRKTISLLLSFVMILSLVPVELFAFATDGQTNELPLDVYHNGTISNEVVLDIYKRESISAASVEGASYQWYVLNPDVENQWIKISDKKNKDCSISYALIVNKLNKEGAAYLRCDATVGEIVYRSNPVKISVSYPVNLNNTTVVNKQEKAEPEEQMSKFSLSRNATRANEYVHVEVEYVYEDNTKAFESYIAYLEAGSDFTATVRSPIIIGYDPFLDDKAADEIKLSFDEINENITYTVVYKPKVVTYTVKHYFQNIYDDLYTENAALAEIKEGKVGTYPETAEMQLAPEGFSALYLDSERIAADGSTVFHCYYDRNYYLVDFDLNGGYGVEPIYARFDTPFAVNTPIYHGFLFDGWDMDNDNGPDPLPSTIPNEDMRFKALWSNSITQYNVVYWREKADVDGKYDFWGFKTVKNVTSGTKVSGTDDIPNDIADNDETSENERDYYYFHHADTDVVIEGDGSTVINVYYHRNQYTITFKAKGLCVLDEHTHNSGCMSCTLEIHEHGTGCYAGVGTRETSYNRRPNVSNPEQGRIAYGRGNSSSKKYIYIGTNWYNYSGTTDVGSVAPTTCGKPVHIAHTASCYSCPLEEHTHSNTCKSSTGTNVVKVVKRKYDASLVDLWPILDDNGVKYEGNMWTSSVTGNYYGFLEKMPGYSMTLTARNTGSYEYNWYYYLEVLPGQSTEGLTIRTDGGKTYYEYLPVKVKDSSSSLRLTYTEDYFPITGFDQRDDTVPSFNNRVAYLYYTRNINTVTFNNNGYVMDDKTTSMYFGDSLSKIYFEPGEDDYPPNLEKNAYYFEGWYPTEECFPLTKIDFSAETMPDGPLILYANWVSKTHTVSIYNSYSDLINNNMSTSEVVNHGDVAQMVDTPQNGNLRFVGWFYFDAVTGEKKVFKFQKMPVNNDIKVYAEWTSDQLAHYTVNYVVKDTNGETKVAKSITGLSYVGTTKTFSAKAGADLFENYRDRWYPTVNSTSDLIDADESQNVITFEYVYLEHVPYKVRYINRVDNSVLHEEKSVEDNSAAVVTETFVPVKDFISDSYNKRLVLSADFSKNVITFYYLPNDKEVFYIINHHIEEDDGYSVYSSIQDIGEIGDTLTAYPITITGYTYNPDISTTSTKLTEAGGELNLYYDKNPYSYVVKFLEYGTDKVLATEISGKAKYGTQLEFTAPDIEEHTLIGEATRVLEVSNNEKLNVLIFYYQIEEHTILYVPVCKYIKDDFGIVSPSLEVVRSNSQLLGSTPRAEDGFRFKGWYMDAECTVPVSSDDAIIDTATNKLVPTRVEDFVFYALFEPLASTLTIEKSGVANTDLNQTFIFNVKGKDDGNKDVDITVSITGNGSVTINNISLGNYSVKELTDWSWRYGIATDSASSQDVSVGIDGASASFKNSSKNLTWLGGEFINSNEFEFLE